MYKPRCLNETVQRNALTKLLKRDTINDTVPCTATQRAVLVRKSFERVSKELRRSCVQTARLNELDFVTNKFDFGSKHF